MSGIPAIHDPADYGTDGAYTCTNLFIKELAGTCGFFGEKTAVSETVGWLVIILFGFVFSVILAGLVFLDQRFGDGDHSSEHFNTAGRSVKTGLTACVIVSQWTWAATLLQSSNVAWKFGVSGPFWYAAGATIQVVLFAVLAILIKRRAPKAHTILEVVKVRWGTAAHCVFMFFAFATNLIVTAMLILGGASVVNALSGVNLYAAAMLIPLCVTVYTAAGGLKATFLAAWSHTAVLYIALLTFMFWVYVGGTDYLGSIEEVYNNMKIVEEFHPVENNKEGSYLTFFSKQGLIFGVINVVGNFGTVFVDQSYWQSAIAAKPSSTYWGYIMGGVCWFAVPFCMATTHGMAARAMDLPLTPTESGSGLTPPAVAVQLAGAGGGFLLLFQLFMAVTATGAAEQIAVASLVAYDIYREYINPKCTAKQLLWVSRVMVFVYAIISGVAAVVLFKIGLNLGWVYLFMGIVIGSAVPPIAMCLMWRKTSAVAAISGAVIGMIGAVSVWLLVAGLESKELTVDTLGKDYPMLAGNVTALGLSLIVTSVLSFVMPQNFDWEQLDNIKLVETDERAVLTDSEKAGLDTAYKWTCIFCVSLTIVLIIIWPLLALIPGVWSKGYFTFYVILAFIWGILATVYCILAPIIEALPNMITVLKNMVTCNQVEQKHKGHPNVVDVNAPKDKDMDPSGHSSKPVDAV